MRILANNCKKVNETVTFCAFQGNNRIGKRGEESMYAVIALFDSKTEREIREIWAELSEQSISFYAEKVENNRPHLTIASYDHLSMNEFAPKLERFYQNKSKLPITLQSLGIFLNTSVLYIAPSVNKELLDFHQAFHDYFKQYNTDQDSLYLPGKWVPHCTIANRLNPESLEDAMSYCLQRLRKLAGKIESIAVIETIFENGECISAPIIHEVKLKESFS